MDGAEPTGQADGSGQILTPADEALLRRAIALALRSRAVGNHPFGALLADESGNVLLESENEVNSRGDITAHAEMLLASAAARVLEPGVRATASLFTSTEPCAMCAGAIYWAGIGRVVYAMAEADLDGLTQCSDANPTMHLECRTVLGAGRRSTVVVGPALVAEATAVHAGFWT